MEGTVVITWVGAPYWKRKAQMWEAKSPRSPRKNWACPIPSSPTGQVPRGTRVFAPRGEKNEMDSSTDITPGFLGDRAPVRGQAAV